jgi:hypothetical protein
MCFKDGTIYYEGVNVGPLLFLENKINSTEMGVKKARGVVIRAQDMSFWQLVNDNLPNNITPKTIPDDLP